MATFRYYAPAPEEQKSFAVLCLGSTLAIVTIAVMGVWKHDLGLRSVLVGAGLAVVYQLGRAAWQLEMRGQRAAKASVCVEPEELVVTDYKGRVTRVPWISVNGVDVAGGKLVLQWPGGRFSAGARELENGMALTQAILDALPKKKKPTNFIPLEPR